MAESSEVYNVTINRADAVVSRAGFAAPLILGYSNRFADLYRVYSLSGANPLASLVSDGFLATDPEHRMVSALIASAARPDRVVIANGTLRPTQSWRLTPTAANSFAYKARIMGPGSTTALAATYTSDSSATVAEVCTGLAAAITALAISGITATDATTHVEVTASTPGAWFSVTSLTRDKLAVEQNHADPGVATDLAALLTAAQAAGGTADWYAVLLPFASSATILAAAAWAQTNKRLLLVASNNTHLLRAPTSDFGSSLVTSAHDYIAVLYHHLPDEFADARWAGRCLPLEPGTETWVQKTLPGATPTDLTGSEITQLQTRRITYYRTVKGINMTVGEPGGTVPSGDFIDNVRGVDALAARVAEDWTASIADVNQKIPYDNSGFQQVRAIIEASMRSFESAPNAPRLLVADSTIVTVPLRKDVSASDASNRRIPVTASADLAGAVHKASVTITLR